MESWYYIYIMRCSGDRLYTGYTSDPVKRFNEHKTGKKGAKFTRGFKPVSFEAIWKINGTRGDAMKIEAFIKSFKRIDKNLLIREPLKLKEFISEVFPQIQVIVSDMDSYENSVAELKSIN